LLTGSRQQELFDALVAGCEEFGYHLTDASVEAWHLHWIIEHDDKVSEMVGRLKNRMRQALAIGRIWTVGYWDRVLHDQASLLSTRHYIARHRGCRMTDGKFSVL
jgi:REP element-mobilizing transposase RayT